MDPRAQLDDILPRLNALVAPLTDAELEIQTSCSSFTVRNVVEHMLGGATMFAAAFRGEGAADPVDGDLVATFPTATADLQRAIHTPGALDRTISAPFGDIPGEAFARFVALDGLVHGWDISTAIGVPYDPPSDVVADVDSFARQAISDEMRSAGMFASPVEAPEGASPLLRLVAFTGRDI